ncbi:MAG: hypothetical protein M3P29_11905 [Acidobacteriota bacterium]|nr:hypothetical protein [Acidobacteriota bacterium]
MTIEGGTAIEQPASLGALIEKIESRAARVGVIVVDTRNIVPASAVKNGRLYKA